MIRKYKPKTTLEKMTNLNKREVYIKKTSTNVSEKVVKFRERDDNSRLKPGKTDVKSGKESI